MISTGIVTFQRAHNYGALLQCYALKMILRKLGYQPTVIDHINPFIKNVYPDGSMHLHGNLVSRLKQFIRFMLTGRRIKRRFKVFENFIATRLMPDSKENLQYDNVIYGSDQIWNDNITFGDTFYWGEGIKTKKRIGYAVSAGNYEDNISAHIDSIRKFDAIGVREASLSDRLKESGIQGTECVLDPTLLLDRDEWINVLNLKKTKKNKPYVLVYPLREREQTVRFAKQLAKREKIDFIEIAPKISLFPHWRTVEDAGPVQFLELIMNADYVVTNSFHGTVFSIIFNRPFITLNLQDGNDNRGRNLLESIGLLHNHLTFDEAYSSEGFHGGYASHDTNHKIQALRNDSLQFLRSNLRSIPN